MKRWLILLGGPLIWAAHFAAIYALASLSVVTDGEATQTARAAIIAVGVVLALAAGGLLWFASRLHGEEPLDQFWRLVSALGALIALVAIVWQTLPALAPI